MSITPFDLHSLIPIVALEDSQPANSPQSPAQQQQGMTTFLRRSDNRGTSGTGTVGVRLAGGIGRANRENPRVTIDCVETWNNNIYIGTSDGNLLHYVLEDLALQDTNLPRTRLISKRNLGFKQKFIERILLLPRIRKAVILCGKYQNSTLSLYSLPDMTPLPPNAFPQVKDVTCFCQNLALEGAVDKDGFVRLCVMKKRAAINFLTISLDRATEEPYLPGGGPEIYVAYRFGRYVCVADFQDYKMIDLKDKKMVTIATYNDRSQKRMSNHVTSIRPLIAVATDREFLTLGQFVTFSGEPTRGVLTWPSFPRAIGVEFPYVVALLQNDSIEIHDLINQKPVQIFQINPSVEPRTISRGSGVRLLVTELLQKLSWVPLTLHKDNGESTKTEGTKKGQPDGAMEREKNKIIKKISTVPAQVILGGKDSIMALANKPIIVQVDQLLDAHRVEEALNWAENHSRDNAAPDMHDARMQHELFYTYQRAGLIFLGETLFDDALQMFEKGHIDPRLIIHLFKDFQEFVDDDSIYVYRGVKDLVERLGTIEDIVSHSLSKNYDPHIKPNASTAPETQELRRTLIFNSKVILQKFLAKDRANRTSGHRPLNNVDKKILKAVDNVLVKLYAESNSREPLNALLENENFCLLEWCEQVLLDTKKFYALSLLYKNHEKWRKTLDTWQRILTDELPDNDFQNGLKRMGDLLSQLDDADLVWEYASWVMLKDEVIGAKIFIRDPRKPLLVEPTKVINGLRAVGQDGLKLYLEYLVIQRRSKDKAHQMELAEILALLPDVWSVEMLQKFLVRSLRLSHHEYREEQILKGISRGENTLVKHELFKAREEIGPIVITTNLSCAICQNLISDSVFIRQPNSDIVHLHCGQNPGARAEN
ncbi:5490_t:CDS:10 [Paraglomus occultum]|uniref:5490_t:CDS:1 n=1 Tax=Paraglomus occultum TaxID=144539 RepID=A0A9N8Z9B3_9GLOM|nr:5490_t:CDS:10 [Paraglomus occultum]